VETRELEEDRVLLRLNLGPQHPSTHGVFRAIVTLEGETIVDLEPVVGYLHRNHEKIYEHLQYPMIVPFTDRLDYLSAINNELGYVLAVEGALGIEVPERARVLRVLFSEFQRILYYQLFFGTLAMDLGATTPFLLAFRDRERGYDLMERVTGARLLYNYLRIGGLRNDVPDGWLRDLEAYLDYFEREAWPQYMDLLLRNEIFLLRTKEVGVLPSDLALAYGASGPVLRGSGIPRDLRKDDPYSGYENFQFEIPVGERGDSYDRCVVRLYEMLESIRIIRQALSRLPDGPVMGQLPRGLLKLPPGEYYQRVEAPSGELAYYLVSDGGPAPYRAKIRSPSFVHLQLMPHLCRGHKLADVIVILSSIFPVFGEVDR